MGYQKQLNPVGRGEDGKPDFLALFPDFFARLHARAIRSNTKGAPSFSQLQSPASSVSKSSSVRLSQAADSTSKLTSSSGAPLPSAEAQDAFSETAITVNDSNSQTSIKKPKLKGRYRNRARDKTPTFLPPPEKMDMKSLPKVTFLFTGFPPPYETMQQGLSLRQICQRYPNHLQGDVLIPFVQQRWSSRSIFELLPQACRSTLLARGSDNDAWIQKNLVAVQAKLRDNAHHNQTSKSPSIKLTAELTVARPNANHRTNHEKRPTLHSAPSTLQTSLKAPGRQNLAPPARNVDWRGLTSALPVELSAGETGENNKRLRTHEINGTDSGTRPAKIPKTVVATHGAHNREASARSQMEAVHHISKAPRQFEGHALAGSTSTRQRKRTTPHSPVSHSHGARHTTGGLRPASKNWLRAKWEERAASQSEEGSDVA